MATAYHPVEMAVNIMTSAGSGPVPNHHHHHHHHHHSHQSHLQPHSDDLLFADEPNPYYEANAAGTASAAGATGTATATGGQSDYYSPQPIFGHTHMDGGMEVHQHIHPHQSQHNGPTAESCAFHGNAHTSTTAHHLMTAMAAEDGYWGSPCSSDSTTNGRDYSPDDSLTNCQPSSASPQYLMSPHQYAPVYYPPQYDRPEIHYEDAATGPTVASTGPAGGYYDAVTSAVADGTPTAASHGETGVPGAAVGIDGIDSTTATSCHHHQLVAAAGGMLDGVQRPVPFVRVVKRRTTANKKERRRTQSINSAFTFLRDCIPNVPSDTKLSKIKTLRLATSYISYLTRVLEGDQDPSGGFRAELVPSSRKINAERRAKYEAQGLSLEDIGALCLSSSNTGSTDSTATATQKKAKGRTGWPQHVWASELKQEQ